jgi:hypothetical protein
MARMPRRIVAVAGVSGVTVLVLGLATLVGRQVPPPATFRASHVDVTVAVVLDGTRRVIEARFVPDAQGLHLYGPDLPAGGVDGAGRPTLVAIVSGGWVAGDGMTMSVAPTPYSTALTGFSAPFSVLPAGPATLRIPLDPAPGDPAAVRVALTFMACTSDGRCFPPVVGQELVVAVP